MYNWIETTFNVSGGVTQAIAVVLALAVVLLLFGLFIFILKRLMGGQTVQSRGRQPRIAVMDSATVDARRRLVLVRRDNIEHLLLIGGPSDVVVEQNILRNAPLTQQRPAQAPGLANQAPVRGPMAPGPDIPVRPDDLVAQNEPAPSPIQQARPPAPVSAETPTSLPKDKATPSLPIAAAQPVAPIAKQPTLPSQPATTSVEAPSSTPAPVPSVTPEASRSSRRATDLLKAAAQNGFNRALATKKDAAPKPDETAPSEPEAAALVRPETKPSEPAVAASGGKGSSALKSLARPFSPRERPSYGTHSISPPASGPAARAKTALLKPLEAARQQQKVEPVMEDAGAASLTEAPAAAGDLVVEDRQPEADMTVSTAPVAAADPATDPQEIPVATGSGTPSVDADAATTEEPSQTITELSQSPEMPGADAEANAVADASPAAEAPAQASEGDQKPEISLDMSDLLEDLPETEPAAAHVGETEPAPSEEKAPSQDQVQTQQAPAVPADVVVSPAEKPVQEQKKPVEAVKAAPRPTAGLGDRNPIEDEMAKILDELGGQPN